MKLFLKRIAKKKEYTIGKLYIDNVYFCDTIEDTDRCLDLSMTELQVRSIKIPGKTAIPTGTYKINMNIISSKFGSKPFYKLTCNGKLPRLMEVVGYQGVLIHAGNTLRDSAGCLLVGKNKKVGMVLESKETFAKLVKEYLIPANKRNESITITIL